ncbi:hypothetical protein SOVF_010280 [Spinacia oleracea]|nr:hypothetical protein SOVF_010280 [Spinacia oleracea]
MEKIKLGDGGSTPVKSENVITNIGVNRLGIGHVGVSQPVVSGVSYAANSGRETGMYTNNTSQLGNQYSGRYAGGATASRKLMTCSRCGRC